MHKNKKLISVFLGLIISISLFSNFTQAKEINAAFLYQEAVSLFKKLPPTVKEKIERIIQEGWIADNQDVKGYITKNKKAIDKFKEATKLNYCDFTFGKKIKNIMEEKAPNYAEISNLVRLTIAEAKLFEKEKRLNLALDNYLAVLRFISHLEKQKKFILFSKLYTIYFQRLLFKSLAGFINQIRLSRQNCYTLLNALISLRNNKKGLKDAFVEEKENMKNMEKMLMEEAKEKGVYSHEFYQKFNSEFNRLIDEFYGYLIVAFQENNLQYYEEKITQFRKNLEKEIGSLNLAQNILRESFSKNTPYLAAKILACIAMPSFSKAITNYYISLAELNILITAAAVKLYEIDKGSLPDRLEDLIPEYIPQVYKDPFNNFKPLTYRKTKTGWVVYSFGPDKKDDLGKVKYDYKKPPKGDIVFLSF